MKILRALVLLAGVTGALLALPAAANTQSTEPTGLAEGTIGSVRRM